MAVLPDYVSGTITVTQGEVNFTGTNTLWRAMGFREGDTVQLQGFTAIIKGTSEFGNPIDSNVAGQFVEPWPGQSGTFAYRMRFLPDGARFAGKSTNLIELLGNGVLSNLAELGVEDGKVPVGNASGEYELADLVTDPNGALAKFAELTLAARQIFQTDENGALKALALLANKFIYTDANKDLAQGDITPWAISMLGLTGTADRLAYLNAANTSALTPLTAFGRSVIGGANAAAVRTTLGLGTASTRDVGTSGSVIPILNASNLFSGTQQIEVGGQYQDTLVLNNTYQGSGGRNGGKLASRWGGGAPGGMSSVLFAEDTGTFNQATIAHAGYTSTYRFWNFRGDGSAYANSGSWVNSSDKRLKTDITSIPDPLEALKKLNGCAWTRIDTGASGIGLIAQDAEEAVPGCSQVSEKEKTLPDGTTITDVLALDTGGVAAAVLVEACKMMLARIEQLEGRIAEMTD